MTCVLPLGRLYLKRILQLDTATQVLVVSETIQNTDHLGRAYNLVQHVTIAPPFLDPSVVVDANAARGIAQVETPEDQIFTWPEATVEDRPFDLRRLTDDAGPTVASFRFNDSETYGWVTACNPEQGLMIGYVWKLSEYPWLSLWYSVKDGKPTARGLEFGTTGLHQPFETLLEKGNLLNRPLFAYLDAGEIVQKSYVAFLAKIPANYKGVHAIQLLDNTVEITEHETDRKMTLAPAIPMFTE